VNLATGLLDRISRERLAQLVSAASYGSVLVLAALSAISIADVEIGHGVELVAGVGVATWIAHLYAELLGRQVEHRHRLQRGEILEDMVDGSPILVACLLPAIVLNVGRLDAVGGTTAKRVAMVVALLQLLGIGWIVSRLSAAPFRAKVIFAVITVVLGVIVVVVTVLLGH
jgi:hypothetical protein